MIFVVSTVVISLILALIAYAGYCFGKAAVYGESAVALREVNDLLDMVGSDRYRIKDVLDIATAQRDAALMENAGLLDERDDLQMTVSDLTTERDALLMELDRSDKDNEGLTTEIGRLQTLLADVEAAAAVSKPTPARKRK